MPLDGGTVFADYSIVRMLGSGGMGEVYLAAHPRLPRHDALKILTSAVSADTVFRERFSREADIAAVLSHPHIVAVYDRGEFDGQLWIAMQYVDGTDTARLVRDRYPAGMPAAEAVEIVTAVAGALDYAYQQGLLHRDVKPANILLSQPDHDGRRRVFLADFGIARELADPNGLTATNLTVGTVAYTAPEQLMGLELDGRADQYALAATAFHLLTGTPPYQHSNPVAVISQHLTAPLPKLSDQRPDLANLDEVFSKALAKDPGDRFERCGQFATVLSERVTGAAISDHATQAATPIAQRPTAPRENRRWRPRIVLLGAAIAVVVLIAVGVIGYMHQPKHNTASTSSPPAAVLDGTYRFVYDPTKDTTNGASNPGQTTDNTSWWAFRSLCTSTGCVATGTKLDTNNPKVGLTPAVTSVLRFADGHWQATPVRDQSVQQPQCLGVDGKVVAGSYTIMGAWSLEPQPDGALRGVFTETALTNECGQQGVVWQNPFVANRTGDVVPTGVTVADPAGVPAAPSTSAPAPPSAGPVLDGAYRVDLDDANQTVNGHPGTGDLKRETQWWAFHSSCTSTRCVATGAGLSDSNQQVPAGDAKVLQFTNGGWQDTPALVTKACDTGIGNQSVTFSLSLQPQPDGTLRGTNTITVLTNECGKQGNVYKTPVVATRTGDVPPAVVLADPALFMNPS